MKNRNNVIAVLVVTVILIAAFLWQTTTKKDPCLANCSPTPTITKSAGTYTLVSAVKFKSQITANPTVPVLDIRTPEEFAEGRIASAVNVDFNNTAEFAAYIAKLDKTQRYFVYCRSGNRSAQAVAQFKKLGFANITELNGGIVKWQAADLPIVK
jgi:rhodanese-related sulfurtransferase